MGSPRRTTSNMYRVWYGKRKGEIATAAPHRRHCKICTAARKGSTWTTHRQQPNYSRCLPFIGHATPVIPTKLRIKAKAQHRHHLRYSAQMDWRIRDSSDAHLQLKRKRQMTKTSGGKDQRVINSMSASKATSIEHGQDRASFNVGKNGAMEVTIERCNELPR